MVGVDLGGIRRILVFTSQNQVIRTINHMASKLIVDKTTFNEQLAVNLQASTADLADDSSL